MNAARTVAKQPIATRIFAQALLAFGLMLTLAAPAPAWAQAGSGSPPAGAELDAQREHLWQLRNIMHNATFTAESTADGVRVTVTAAEPSLEAAIRAQFGGAPASPVAGSTVSATEVAGGVELVFSSDDAAVVAELQGYGAGVAYWLLRNDMHAAMLSLGGQGGWGPGMMGPGAGYGHMRGWNRGGPGAGPQGSGAAYGPGEAYGPGQGYGYGRGQMMGTGYGPGAGYGRMHGGWFWSQPLPADRTTE